MVTRKLIISHIKPRWKSHCGTAGLAWLQVAASWWPGTVGERTAALVTYRSVGQRPHT